MDTLFELVSGNLSPHARVWSAMAPALFLLAYFIIGFFIYIVRYFLKGAYRDPEIESRGSSIFANMWIRLYFAWIMQPLWRMVVRSGIPANAVTTLSLLLSLASGIALAAGRFALGGWLYIFAGICDLLDGRLARSRAQVSKSGGALDSILDRYSDMAVLSGLGWYYRDSWILVAVLLAIMGSALVPYIRAKGESLGVSIKIGVMQRAERILYLGVGCALSPILEVFVAPNEAKPLHRIAIIGIVLLAVATQLTALQRLLRLLSVLNNQTDKARLIETGTLKIRPLTAAFLATILDFSVMLIMVLAGFLSPISATALGCLVGGIINYLINRLWAIHYHDDKLPQMKRYTFVSLTSTLLNSGGVAVLLLLPTMDYRIAWILVRIAVFFAWNSPLHKNYVFATNSTRIDNE